MKFLSKTKYLIIKNQKPKILPTEEQKAKFKVIYSKNLNTPNGKECIFVPLSKEVGIKIYETKKWAKIALLNQKLAYKVGIGPEVLTNGLFYCEFLGDMSFFDTYKRFGWFYVTEIVETCKCNITKNKKYKKLCEGLCEKMGDIGFYCDDIYEDNVGIDKFGNLVCIDFGNVSLGWRIIRKHNGKEIE